MPDATCVPRLPRTLVLLVSTAAVIATAAPPAIAQPPERQGGGEAFDLALAAPGEVAEGGSFDYVVTLHAGGSALDGVSVVDALPPGVSYVSASPSRGSCSEASGTVTCSIGSMKRRSKAEVRITVRAAAAGTVTNTVLARADVAGAEVTREASATTSITAAPAPGSAAVEMTYGRQDADRPAVVGAPLTYVGTITNVGTSVLRDLSVMFEVREDWARAHPVIDSFTVESAACTFGPREFLLGLRLLPPAYVICRYGDVAPGQTLRAEAVVRMHHPTTAEQPLQTWLSAAWPGLMDHPVEATEATVVTTGNGAVDCLVTTGTSGGVPQHHACVTTTP